MAGNLSKSMATSRLVQRGIAPRLLELDLAAAYVGLSADAFLRAVRLRQYPEPLRDGRRRQWDRKALDAAIDARSALAEDTELQETPEDLDRAIDAA